MGSLLMWQAPETIQTLERRVLEIIAASDEPLRLLETRGGLWGWRPDRRGLIRHGQPGRWAPVRRDDGALRRALVRLVHAGAITVRLLNACR